MNNLNYKELMVDYKELVLAVCGPVDAGKSSLIGVLTSGKLDDGRGMCEKKERFRGGDGGSGNHRFHAQVHID